MATEKPTPLPNAEVAPPIADAGTSKTITKEGDTPKTDIVVPPKETVATTPTTTKTTEKPTAKTYAPAEKQFPDLIQQAKLGGLDDENLQGGIDNFNKGYLNAEEFTKWLNKFIKPKEDVKIAEDLASGDTTATDTTAPTPTAEDTIKDAQTDYETTMSELANTYKESQETITKSAEQLYNVQNKNLNDALALQQQLAAQQNALIASSSEIQKQEAKNAYDANVAAVELQKKKVAEAYQAMKEEQKLLNTQRQVREETALGLIYGGFGSVAANKNIEETVIRGERELMQLSKDATNSDTELQNQVVELNKAYDLDVRKIEQWKAEESQKVYASLSKYVQEITADKNMAAVEKDAAIRKAVSEYNTKVAEISTTVAQTRLDLSLEMINRADRLKQQEFTNQITRAQETRTAETHEYEQTRTVINDARTDLDLILSSYATQDYDTLPAAVLAQIKELEQSAKLPEGSASQILDAIKEAELKEGDIVKEFTNSITGEVTAIRYNFDTGKVETMQLGALETPDQPQKVWTEIGTDEDGNIVTMNEVTGEIKTQGQYSGQSGTPADALSMPDDSIGGECGHFVNQYTGLTMSDSYGSKLDLMDTSITKPERGMVFVMPISGSPNGHTGFILSVSADGLTATVKDSNYFKNSDKLTGGGEGRVATHTIPVSSMTGFLDVSGKSGSSSTESTPTEEEAPTETSSGDKEWYED